MPASLRTSARKLAATAAISLLASTTGFFFIHTQADALETEPAWLGPALVIGTLALLVCGLLLLPAVMRSIRRGNP